MNYLLQVLIASLLFGILQCASTDSWMNRKQILQNEELKSVGGLLVLNEKELEVNKILLDLKTREVKMHNEENFSYSNNFFDIKEMIEKTDLFKFIRALPKGANLHSQMASLLSAEKLVEIIYRDIFICIKGKDYILNFDEGSFGHCDIMGKAKEVGLEYKEKIKAIFSLYHSMTPRSTLKTLLNRLVEALNENNILMSFEEYMKNYFYEAFREFYDDNVIYLEFRMIIDESFDFIPVFQYWKRILDEFVENHSDFLGAKLIISIAESHNATDCIYKLVNKLVNQVPNFLAGIDVGPLNYSTVHQKDIDRLKNITNILYSTIEVRQREGSEEIHAAEAVLMYPKRMVHGHTLLKHPDILKLVRENNIALEISPIFDQIFGLGRDLSDHPGTYFIANNFPVVITNNYPMVLGTRGLSYDWYMAFMTMTNVNSDLKFLKQLALNSLAYSTIENKIRAFNIWAKKWDLFLDDVLDEVYLQND